MDGICAKGQGSYGIRLICPEKMIMIMMIVIIVIVITILIFNMINIIFVIIIIVIIIMNIIVVIIKYFVLPYFIDVVSTLSYQYVLSSAIFYEHLKI